MHRAGAVRHGLAAPFPHRPDARRDAHCTRALGVSGRTLRGPACTVYAPPAARLLLLVFGEHSAARIFARYRAAAPHQVFAG